MPFRFLDVDTTADFDEVINCQWSAYENPFQSFFRLFCPIHGDGPLSRVKSIKECTVRQLDWHNSDPTSYWGKVVDDNGKIVGACLWKICPINPFQKPDEHTEAYWYPEGEARDYVSKCLQAFDAPRRKMGARPQLYLNIIYTHPDYRRQGVADLIMAWGKKKADEMGVETWLDATEYGVPVYKKHGFIVVNVNRLKPTKTDPGEEWKKIDKELQPMTFWQMWRPAGGNYREGETLKPWE
ncbi:Fc.00g033750.m01.CDS01 [Cosmosporella sp. VM-42]